MNKLKTTARKFSFARRRNNRIYLNGRQNGRNKSFNYYRNASHEHFLSSECRELVFFVISFFGQCIRCVNGQCKNRMGFFGRIEQHSSAVIDDGVDFICRRDSESRILFAHHFNSFVGVADQFQGTCYDTKTITAPKCTLIVLNDITAISPGAPCHTMSDARTGKSHFTVRNLTRCSSAGWTSCFQKKKKTDFIGLWLLCQNIVEQLDGIGITQTNRFNMSIASLCFV